MMQLARVEFSSIPGGGIMLRDARRKTNREAVLQPFEIARTHVTTAAGVENVVAGVPSDAPLASVSWFAATAWCNRASSRAGLRPAYAVSERNVTWDVSADGYRLPTEAEWEWACRAGSSGPTYGELVSIAWSAADSVGGPQSVGLKAPNAFGLFDTIGNVWEWCWDYADPARYGDYRTLRGGGWADQNWSCRASVRRASAPDAVIDDVGFRVARGAIEPSEGGGAQGWSADADEHRAHIAGPLPIGWTPLGRTPQV